MMVRYGDVNLVTSYVKEMMLMEIGGLCVMGATKSTIFSVVELIMLRKIITALILKLIPSVVKHALNNLFTRFIAIILLQPYSQVTATGFEPTTTYFVNKHSTIWPN